MCFPRPSKDGSTPHGVNSPRQGVDKNEDKHVNKNKTTAISAAISEAASLQAQLDALRAENAALKNGRAKAASMTMKISEKGGLSVYGLGRFPVTLYREQWERLIAQAPEISAFIAANASQMKTKGE